MNLSPAAYNELALAGYKVAVKALEALLRTHAIPQRLDYFFPVSKEEQGDTAMYVELVKGSGINALTWQTAFMTQLASRDAVHVHGNHFGTKNRFFLETLLKESKSGSLRLMSMVRESLGLPQAEQRPSQPPPSAKPTQTKSPVLEDEEPAPPEPEPEIPPADVRPTGNSPEEYLEKILELNVLTLQRVNAIAENVVYVRDRFELRQTKLVERVKGLDSRLVMIEGKLDISPAAAAGIAQEDMEAIAEVVSNTVNSMNSVVGSLKKELRQVMAESAERTDHDRLARIQTSLAKVTSEFAALRELTLEFLPGVAG